MSEKEGLTRREIIKKAAYIAPIITTLKADVSYARAGSDHYFDSGNSIGYIGSDDKDKKDKKDKD